MGLPGQKGRPDISFVIPVRNDALRLSRCLASIRSNDCGALDVEIVVVDNGSVDDGAAIAANVGARVLVSRARGVATLRNQGAEAASGAILAFVDADHAIARGWIARAVELMRRPELVAVGALCHAPENGTWVQRAYDRLRGRRDTGGPVEWLGAGNLVVRRSAFMTAGGFDSTLATCEDVDLCKRLRRRGGTILSDPGLANVHFGDPETIVALFRGELWRGRSNLRVSLRRPISASELPSIAVPGVQLAGLLLCVSSIFWSGSRFPVSLLALSPLALLPIARATRMSVNCPSGTSGFFSNLAVAFAYDCARALALIAPVPHRVRRS